MVTFQQTHDDNSLEEVQGRMVLVVNFFVFLFFVVAIFDLVHDVETIFHLPYLLTASGNLRKGF